jgi:deazaflavin-dependent oxidoreductase (nitroreductase family)
MIPSSFHTAFSGLPVAALLVLAVAGAALLLCSIGAAQATLLRLHVEHAGRWVVANVLGWLAGLGVVFLAFAVAPQHPAAVRVGFALAGGLGMGLAVAAITGKALVRLLREPRTHVPQTLRHRAAVHLNHAHAWAYAHSGGRAGRRTGGHPLLLLTTTGRVSSAPRRTPVQYERIDGQPIVVAAANGAPAPPAWWRNLRADPDVTVQIGDHCWRAKAVTVEGEERQELWPRLCALNRHLEPLQHKAGRELPLVRLEDLASHIP